MIADQIPLQYSENIVHISTGVATVSSVWHPTSATGGSWHLQRFSEFWGTGDEDGVISVLYCFEMPLSTACYAGLCIVSLMRASHPARLLVYESLPLDVDEGL